jgi:hypothetical protein
MPAVRAESTIPDLTAFIVNLSDRRGIDKPFLVHLKTSQGVILDHFPLGSNPNRSA